MPRPAKPSPDEPVDWQCFAVSKPKADRAARPDEAVLRLGPEEAFLQVLQLSTGPLGAADPRAVFRELMSGCRRWCGRRGSPSWAALQL